MWNPSLSSCMSSFFQVLAEMTDGGLDYTFECIGNIHTMVSLIVLSCFFFHIQRGTVKKLSTSASILPALQLLICVCNRVVLISQNYFELPFHCKPNIEQLLKQKFNQSKLGQEMYSKKINQSLRKHACLQLVPTQLVVTKQGNLRTG